VSTATQPEALRQAELLEASGILEAADELRRLHAENQPLCSDMDAIGAGGVGPLIPAKVQHQLESSSDNELQRESSYLSTTSSSAPVTAQPPGVAARTCANCLHNEWPFGNCDGCSQQKDDMSGEGNWERMPEPPVGEQPARRKADQMAYSLGKLMDDEIARVKAEQPQGEQKESAAWIVWWGIGEMRPHNRLFGTRAEAEAFAREIKSNTEIRPVSYTHQQPKRKPLTDEQWLKRWTGKTGQRLKSGQERDRLLRLFRFAERAHGITGGA
jgi:hypothetical protein